MWLIFMHSTFETRALWWKQVIQPGISVHVWEHYQPNEIAVRVSASAETHWTVAMKELLKERATGEPHPAACVHAPVGIQKKLLKHLSIITTITLQPIRDGWY